MANNDKSLCWSAQDFAGEESKLETFAARFQNADACKQFKEAFEAARDFNNLAKEDGEGLVWASTVEDAVEVREDDIDTNKTADGGDDE